MTTLQAYPRTNGDRWTVLHQEFSHAAKRLFDVLVAGPVLLLGTPVLLLNLLLAVVGMARIERLRRVGVHGRVFNEYTFQGGFLQRLPVLWNVLRGDMSLVGPRAVGLDDALALDPRAEMRFNVLPGVVCLHWLRRRANIDYSSERVDDYEYIADWSVGRDLGILVRALPALVFGHERGLEPDQLTVLGIPIDNLTLTDASDDILRRLELPEPSQVCFVNADCANIASRNDEYRDVLHQASLTLADGMGLKLAGKILGRPIRQNVNGTDLFPRLCEALSKTDKGVFLLGGRPGVAEGVRDWIVENHRGVEIRGVQHGYFTAEEEPEVVRRIAESNADLLLVAFGAPRQDVWIHQHLHDTGVRVAIGVGGLFDFYSGRMPRAPQWMRELGLEWFYRLTREPGRLWKRYLVGNGVFLARVLGEKLRPIPAGKRQTKTRAKAPRR